MGKKMKLLKIVLVIVLFIGCCYGLYKFVSRIHNEKVDTSYMWNIKRENIKITEGSKEGKLKDKEDGISLDVTLSKPKEYYEVTFDVVNKGTLTAFVSEITKEIVSTDDILKCQITYWDNSVIKKGDILSPSEKKTIKIRIEYPSTKTKIYKKLQLSLNFKIIYKAHK